MPTAVPPESPYADPNVRMPEYHGSTNPRYAAPDISEDAPYHDSPIAAYAPHLGPYAGEGISTPDTFRLGSQTQYEMRPQANRPPEEYYNTRDADTKLRHSVESVDADGMAAQSPGSKRAAANPRSTPPAEPRPTSRLSPHAYSFTRPFDQENRAGARRLNGVHFSMADHRRNYEILGMAPARTTRNTYRLDPPPWDANIVDLPPETSTPVDRTIQAVDVPYHSRNWRLG